MTEIEEIRKRTDTAIEKVRRVRTPAGAKKYGKPIGAPLIGPYGIMGYRSGGGKKRPPSISVGSKNREFEPKEQILPAHGSRGVTEGQIQRRLAATLKGRQGKDQDERDVLEDLRHAFKTNSFSPEQKEQALFEYFTAFADGRQSRGPDRDPDRSAIQARRKGTGLQRQLPSRKVRKGSSEEMDDFVKAQEVAREISKQRQYERLDTIIEKVRRVRTPAGAKKYGKPIGSPLIGGGGGGSISMLRRISGRGNADQMAALKRPGVAAGLGKPRGRPSQSSVLRASGKPFAESAGDPKKLYEMHRKDGASEPAARLMSQAFGRHRKGRGPDQEKINGLVSAYLEANPKVMRNLTPDDMDFMESMNFHAERHAVIRHMPFLKHV